MVFRSAHFSCLHEQCQPGSVGISTTDGGFGRSSLPRVATCHARVWAELGLSADVLLTAGIDRLDYTKGVEERFLAVERMREGRPDLVGRSTFVQLAAPSRAAIDRHRELNDAVEKLSERINARFARDDEAGVLVLSRFTGAGKELPESLIVNP
jgi:trehalose 6-phosphate synthase